MVCIYLDIHTEKLTHKLRLRNRKVRSTNRNLPFVTRNLRLKNGNGRFLEDNLRLSNHNDICFVIIGLF